MAQTIGKLLRNWRSGKELSQKDAARVLQVNLESYRRWEQDRGFPSGDHLNQIMETIVIPARAAKIDLTQKEARLLRLALDAETGLMEYTAAASSLIQSWRDRGLQFEDIGKYWG